MVLRALKKKKTARSIKAQTPEEQMYLLKLGAHQILGAKWIHYKKIKLAGSSGKLFKSKDLTEEMKATQSALKFTSKNASRQYRVTYQAALKDIKSYTGSTEGFPELDEQSEGALTSEFDAVIISWTPIKFLLPAKQVREKGTASQRHTEGLIAKLYFKVAGYYSNPLNWDSHKLSLYLAKINKDSTYQEVVMALEPLKKDLLAFSEQYEPFKFGKAALSKDVAQDADTFDDAMEDESFESQIRTLYWHRFIYEGIELFLFRYYLTLVTSTASIFAMRYLTTIFEPALKHAIENRMVFTGSFDTDISRRQYQRPFEKYRRERLKDQLKKSIKTQKGVFEVFNYNQTLLQKVGIRHTFTQLPANGSQWWKFTRQYILGIERPVVVTTSESSEQSKQNLEEEALKKQELKELQQELVQVEEEFHEADDELGELNLEWEDINPDEKEKKLLLRKKTLEMEKKDIEIRMAKLEAEKGRLTEREQRLNQEEEKHQEAEALFNQQLQELSDSEKNHESAKFSAQKDQESIQNQEKKLDEEEKAQFELDKTLDDRIEELKIQKADADVGEMVQKEILESQKEKKNISETKKRIEKEKKELYKLQADNKETLERLANEANRLVQERKSLNEKKEAHGKQVKSPADLQNELAEIHAEVHQIDVEAIQKRKDMGQIDQKTSKIDKNLIRLKEKTKQLQDAIKLAEKNLQGPLKKREEITNKIETIRQEEAQKVAAQKQAEEEARAMLGDLNSAQTRYTALVHILTSIIKCNRHQKSARSELLNRFENRIAQDLDLAKKRIAQIKKESDKKIRQMTRKVSKLKRMKQESAAVNYEADLDAFKQKTDKKCEAIIANSKSMASMQRKRLGNLKQQIDKERSQSDAHTAIKLIELTNRAANGNGFNKEFKEFILEFVSQNYIKELETFYHHIFEVVGASILDKVAILQALQKSAGGDVPVSLSESDLEAFGSIVRNMKDRINETMPMVFESSVDLYSSRVQIDQLLNLRIDNTSMQKLLSLKVTPAGSPKQIKLQTGVVKSLLSLNNLLNPVPFFNLLQPGRENEKDPLKAIDVPLLNKLITEAKAGAR